MVASVHTAIYRTKTGEKRYVVRCRAGGRESKLRHLASFKTRREANACVEWAQLELAQGRVPDLRGRLAATEAVPSVRVALAGWLASRVDLSEGSRRTYEAHAARVDRSLGLMLVTRVQPGDVERLISEISAAGRGRQAAKGARMVLAAALDRAGVTPNPARAVSVRLPREQRSVITPPPIEHVRLILRGVPVQHRVVLALLEATGARVDEATSLAWGDVDLLGERLRLHGKNRKLRWVPCPVELIIAMGEPGKPEDRVFSSSADALRGAMERACRRAGIPHYHPHDLRHRFISRLVQQGVPITRVSELVGHASSTLTLGVYAHVLSDTELGWPEALAHSTNDSDSRNKRSTSSRRA